jgi:hypothetical protein
MPIAALCRHSTRQAGEIHAVGRRCQIRVSQFASLFVSFSVLLVETQPFPPHRVRADDHRSSRRCRSAPAEFFGLESAECPICRENVASGAAQASPRPHRDGVRRALAADSRHDFAPAA